jgi:hypothetical protein
MARLRSVPVRAAFFTPYHFTAVLFNILLILGVAAHSLSMRTSRRVHHQKKGAVGVLAT